MTLIANFTPLEGCLGGALIGFAAATLLLVNGDMLASSSIMTATMIHPRRTLRHNSWKYIFTASFLAASNLYYWVMDSNAIPNTTNGETRSLSVLGWIVAGFLVGFGTKLGNGCTSGHGVCGMARLCPRNIVAVCTFMAFAMLVASILGLEAVQRAFQFLHKTADDDLDSQSNAYLIIVVAVPIAIMAIWSLYDNREPRKIFGSIASGIIFAFGLGVSGMVQVAKVLNFLDLGAFARGTYDPTLISVMGVACIVSFSSYQLKQYKSLEKPYLAETFSIPDCSGVDANLLVGAMVFGIGWGLAGLCPGAALFRAAVGIPSTVYMWLPGYLVGALVAEAFMQCQASRRNHEDEEEVDGSSSSVAGQHEKEHSSETSCSQQGDVECPYQLSSSSQTETMLVPDTSLEEETASHQEQ